MEIVLRPEMKSKFSVYCFFNIHLNFGNRKYMLQGQSNKGYGKLRYYYTFFPGKLNNSSYTNESHVQAVFVIILSYLVHFFFRVFKMIEIHVSLIL